MTDVFARIAPVAAGSPTTVAETALPSTGVLIVLGVVVLVQIALLVAALVDLLRRPDEAVTGGRRWVWLLVVIFFQTIGPIIYFAAGRRPRPAEPSQTYGPPTTPAAGGDGPAATPGLTTRAPGPSVPSEPSAPSAPSAPSGAPVDSVVDLLYGPAGDQSAPSADDDPQRSGEQGPPSGHDDGA